MRRARLFIVSLLCLPLIAAAGWNDDVLQTGYEVLAPPVVTYSAGETSYYVGALEQGGAVMVYDDTAGYWVGENIGGSFGALSFGQQFDFGLDYNTLPYFAITNDDDSLLYTLYTDGANWDHCETGLVTDNYFRSLSLIPFEGEGVVLAGIEDVGGGADYYQLYKQEAPNLYTLGPQLWYGTYNDYNYSAAVYDPYLRAGVYSGNNGQLNAAAWQSGSETWDTSYVVCDTVTSPFDAAYILNPYSAAEEVYVAYLDDSDSLLHLCWDFATGLQNWIQLSIPDVYPLHGWPISLYLAQGAADPGVYPRVVYAVDDGGEYKYQMLRYDDINDLWVVDDFTPRSADAPMADITCDDAGYPMIVYSFNDVDPNDGLGYTTCDNYPPNPCNLELPVNGIELTGLPYTFQWLAASDYEGDPLQYTLQVSPFDDFPAEHTTEFGPVSDLDVDIDGLADGIYYWRVVVDDGGGDRYSHEIWSFTLNGAEPYPLSATAYDFGGEPGIDQGDYVEIVFSEPVQDITGWTDVDDVLPLTNDHTWNSTYGILDFGYSETNQPNDTVVVTLLEYDGYGPTVEPGDMIDFSLDGGQNYLIDYGGNPVIGSVTIDGSFSPAGPEFDDQHPFPTTLEYDQDNTISCSFLSGDVQEVQLYYAAGGTLDWNVEIMSYNSAEDQWEAVLGSSDFDLGGLKYGFYALDTGGGESWFPEGFVSGASGLYPQIHADSVDVDFFLPSGGLQTDYRLISLPLKFPDASDDPESQFSDELGSYQSGDWRMFIYDKAGGDYDEYDPGVDDFLLRQGHVFWMIARDGLESVTLEDATTLDCGEPFEYQFTQGWNWVACPFTFEVDWEECSTDGTFSVEPPIAYTDNGYDDAGEYLALNQGYWIHADGDGAYFIKPTRHQPVGTGGDEDAPAVVSPVSSNRGDLPAVSAATSPGVTAPNPGALGATLDGCATAAAWGDTDNWRLEFALSDDSGIDALHYLGVDPLARPDADVLERHDPPPLAGLPNLFFDHDDWGPAAGRYLTDIRPSYDDGAEWCFHLDAVGAARLSWSIVNGWPADFAAVLITPSGRRVDLLAEDRVELSAAETASDLPCRVYIGTTEWISGEFEARAFTLRQSYPNPAAGLVRIDFALAEAATVELAVYDLAGRRVATLVDGERAAGRHSVGWDASDCAPGVYLYRLESDTESVTRRLVITR